MGINKKQQEIRKAINKLNVAITEAIDKVCEESNYEITYTEINSALTGILKDNLGNVDNESKETMFDNPTFTGTVSGVTKSMVGLSNVDNEHSKLINKVLGKIDRVVRSRR